MSWLTLTYLNLTRKQLKIFLIAFSGCLLAATGIIWACADSDEPTYSVFAPEYFVNKQYSPFFYSVNEVYYNLQYGPTSNERYNDIITDEWYDYFNHQFARKSLKYLLLTATSGAIDTVYKNYTGQLTALPKDYPDSVRGNAKQKQLTGFFNYLQLAKNCEVYCVSNQEDVWYDTIKRLHSPVQLEGMITGAFKKEHDRFIKERLWFQLVRYYYFDVDSNAAIKSVQIFDKYKSKFPKNLTYYRALGYVAGYYHHKRNYALANYLYSLCYNYSYELKIPSYWSFHPQNEDDWQATLKMAKNNDEKITLWQMLGINYDDGRAIKEIAAINPKSEKLDLLLSRVINEYEEGTINTGDAYVVDSLKIKGDDKQLIETIAQQNNTAKPYYWNLAAGYINFIDSDYTKAAKFYAIARKQFPIGDTMVTAQGKLLDILLYVKTLKVIDTKAEQNLTENLDWLADLRDSKRHITDLRYSDALSLCTNIIAKLYNQQGDSLKKICFNDSSDFYTNDEHTQALIDLLNKPNKTSFERAMVRYYPHTINDLYYHQALELVYKDEPEKAIAILEKRKLEQKDFELDANPFTSRLNDCHDCDAAAPQKQKFTPLGFLQTLQKMKDELKAGKNVYRNAYLIAGAYYNITYYGNGRVFYESDVIAPGTTYTYSEVDNTEEIDDKYVDMGNATKYYKLARANAITDEQKARCTFMLSKCALDAGYTIPDTSKGTNTLTDTVDYHYKYFVELKNKYAKTAYYKEVLKECGYFRNFLNRK